MNDPKAISSGAANVAREAEMWLVSAKAIGDATPFVQRTLEVSRQLSVAFANFPAGESPCDMQQIGANVAVADALFQNPEFRLPRNVLPISVTGSAAMSGAANYAAMMFPDSAAKGPVVFREWSTQYLKPIQQIQTQDSSITFISKKLSVLRPGSETEFTHSVSEYHKCRAQIASPTAAGVALRNVLESFNGHMLELARSRSTARVKSWADAAAILARGVPGSAQMGLLSEQKRIYDDLHDKDLTPILKNDKVPSVGEWEAIFSKYVSFLFVVLGLIELHDGT